VLTKLYVENLKIWGDQLWDAGVPLAPISIFLGPNSAGKTSLIQFPLLLKQTFDSTDRHLTLNLGGEPSDMLNFGGYGDIVHGHDPSKELGLGVELGPRAHGEDDPSHTLTYRVTYALDSSGSIVVQRLSYATSGGEYAVERQAGGGYSLSAPGYEAPLIQGRPDARRTFAPERSLMFSSEALAELGTRGDEVQDLSMHLKRAIGHVAYLGPLREHPERDYTWNNQPPGELGSRGERAVQALLASANVANGGDEGGRGWLVGKVSTWLERMGIADGLVLEPRGRSLDYEVLVKSGGESANLVDVGFGISQVLPILVLAYFVPPGSTILTEQPEIHLHPRAQVELANLMVEVARERNVQFVVETHSEHVFRRLQYLIADEQIRPEDCRLYFVDRGPDRAARLQSLAVDAFGRVSNWPSHFFGDATGEIERQMRRAIERMKRKHETPPDA
jgi:predicted ATPase